MIKVWQPGGMSFYPSGLPEKRWHKYKVLNKKAAQCNSTEVKHMCVCVCVCVCARACARQLLSRAQLCDPRDCMQPDRLLCPWNSPDKNTGVGCQSLLQGIFLTQGQNQVSHTADSLPSDPSGKPDSSKCAAKVRMRHYSKGPHDGDVTSIK